MFPFAPPPVFGAFLPSLAHRKYHLPLRQLLLQRLFSCCFCRCRFFVCGGFFCRCFLSAAAFSAAAFSAAFLSAALSLLPLSYQLQPFQQPLSSRFCLGFFSSFGCRFLSCFSCAASAASAFFFSAAAAASAFFALRLRLWRLLLLLFSSRLPRFLRCFFRSFSIRFGLRFSIASAFALASAAAFAAASSACFALTRPVLRLLQPAFSAPEPQPLFLKLLQAFLFSRLFLTQSSAACCSFILRCSSERFALDPGFAYVCTAQLPHLNQP